MKWSFRLILVMLIMTGLLLAGCKPKTGEKQGAAPASGVAKGGEDAPHSGHASQQAQDEDDDWGDEDETPTVEITTEKQRMIGVKTTEVVVKPLEKVIRTVGLIEYDEKRLATVNTKVEGWIEKLHVDYTGRFVKKGEPLAEVYSPELLATQQEFLSVLRWTERGGEIKDPRIREMLGRDSATILEAAKQRLRLWDITEGQIEKISASGKPIRTLTIYSPVSGYVVEKMALQGMRVMPGEKLFDVADLSTVWILSDIYEYELPLIKVGQQARITLSYFPEKEFTSRVEYVYPSLSNETRTAKIRFSIPNQGLQLKPKMYTNVEVKINLGKRLVVPEDAVIDTGVRQVVYVDQGDGYFEPREVRLGLRSEGYREVLAGLKEGDRVASSATFLIDSEAQLKGVQPLGGHAH